jgi:predicted MFS family arabinose efflux permease
MQSPALSRRQVWSAVLSMSLCAFALVASEFMPVSLLTPIAHDLSLREGAAGQAISVSGFFAVLTSLSISSATSRFDRKLVILALTALMVLSDTLVAFAPNYAILMSGRAILGVAIGGVWSMSTAVVMRFTARDFVPRAIAILQGGSALATAVAAPLGSFLGGLVGWRGAFFSVVPLALIAMAWQAISLPQMPTQTELTKPRRVWDLLSSKKIACGMGAVGLLFAGQFALFTYLRPFLESVTRVDVALLSTTLLCIGVCGLMGTIFVGVILKRSLFATLTVIPLVMSSVAVALVEYGRWIEVVLPVLACWGLFATSAPVGWFTWLAKTLPNDAEAGGGLMVAVIQLAITVGATLGGYVFDGYGYRSTFHVSVLLLLLAALVTFVLGHSRRSSAARLSTKAGVVGTPAD